MILFTDVHPVLWQQDVGHGPQWQTGMLLDLLGPPAGFRQDGHSFVRLTGTGEIVLVPSDLLKKDTCREDERKAERLAAEAKKIVEKKSLPVADDFVPTEVAVCPLCRSTLKIAPSTEIEVSDDCISGHIDLVCVGNASDSDSCHDSHYEEVWDSIRKWMQERTGMKVYSIHNIIHSYPGAVLPPFPFQ